MRLNEDVLEDPLRWRKPQTVFVASMGDLFHEGVPDEYIHRVYDVMNATPQHTYIVLTKRPERIVLALYGDGFMPPYLGGGDYLPNVWHLTTVETQEWADKRIPDLLKLRQMSTGWPVLGISAEPLLGPLKLGVYLRKYLSKPDDPRYAFALDWIIVGGESGHHARAMHPKWLRALRNQATAHGIPFFLKSWGAYRPYWEGKPDARFHDGTGMRWMDRRNIGRELDGREWTEMPQREEVTPISETA